MAERKTREEKMSAVQQKLENGVREIFSSEKYKEYIAAMSKFPRYSINNCILIASQYPEASLVCGYRKWQKEFNRVVNKGEKGIMILAPSKGKVEVEEELYDEKHKAVLDENGKQKTEIVTKEYQTFIPVYVFDVSQTQGDPLPLLATELQEQVESFQDIKRILEEISPVPIYYEDIQGEAKGYFNFVEQKIVIKESLPQLQTIKTMIHEIAHATLGHGSKEDKFDQSSREVQAESVAYWVAQMIGLDTSEYSFGYISGWSKDKEVSELKEHLELIKETADKISQAIEEKLEEIKPEQEASKVSEQEINYNSSHRARK